MTMLVDDIKAAQKLMASLHHISRQDIRQALSECGSTDALDERTDAVLTYLCETQQLNLSVNGYYTKVSA